MDLFENVILDINKKYDYSLIQTMKSRQPINFLSTAFNRTLSPTIEGISSLKFDIPKTVEDDITHEIIDNIQYDSIKTENLILLKVGDIADPISQSYYIIKNVSESTDAMTISVECKSLESKLNNDLITITGIERQLVNDVDKDGILDMIEQQTSWRIGHVDESLKYDVINGGTSPRYRWISDLSKPILQFLKDDIAKAFKVLFMFDTYNKLINCYDNENFGSDTGIILSDENYLKSLVKDTKGESICTRLEVSGDNNLSINSVTLDGSSYVTNYDYYIASGQMSEELVLALGYYNALLVQKDTEFKVLKTQLDTIEQSLVTKNTELDTLNILKTGLALIQTNYIVTKDATNLTTATLNCNNNKTAIANKNAEITNLNNQVTATNVLMAVIATDINKSNAKKIGTSILIFNDDTRIELEDWTLTEQWSSSVYTTPSQLKKASEDVLKEYHIPTTEYQVSLIDFYSQPDAQHIWDKIKLGNLIRVYSPKIKTNIDLRIVAYSYNIDTNSLSIDFSNKNKKSDDLNAIGQKMTQAITVGKYVNTKKLDWNLIRGTAGAVKLFTENSLDMAKQNVIGSAGYNKVEISENGQKISDTRDPDKQLLLVAGTLVTTSDNLETVDSYISTDGIAGEFIIGKIIIGENLYIENESSTFRVDETGVTITDSSKIDLTENAQFQVMSESITSQVSQGEFDTYTSQTAQEISAKLTTSTLSTEIQARAGDVQIAFNNIDGNISNKLGKFNIINGAINVTNGSNVVVIDGTHNMHKILTSGTVTLSLAQGETNKTVDVYHNLGYSPCHTAYILNAGGDVSLLGLGSYVADPNNDTFLGMTKMTRCWVNTTRIQFNVIRSINESPANTTTLRYYLYKEVAI